MVITPQIEVFLHDEESFPMNSREHMISVLKFIVDDAIKASVDSPSLANAQWLSIVSESFGFANGLPS